jgi:hypothetical protein
LNQERVLSLDVSTKTGWAFMLSSKDDLQLQAFGMIEQIPEPPGVYPSNYVNWAYLVFGKIVDLIEMFAPDCLVIEETVAGSKSVYSQKILEFCHFLLAKFIRDTGIKVVYFLTGEWRSVVNCRMTKEELLRNKKVRDYKIKNKTKVAKDLEGKRIGKITKKHVNIRRANEIFGEFLLAPLRKKNEDEADALLLGYAYHLRRKNYE